MITTSRVLHSAYQAKSSMGASFCRVAMSRLGVDMTFDHSPLFSSTPIYSWEHGPSCCEVHKPIIIPIFLISSERVITAVGGNLEFQALDDLCQKIWPEAKRTLVDVIMVPTPCLLISSGNVSHPFHPRHLTQPQRQLNHTRTLSEIRL